MPTGTLKEWSPDRGFGFIHPTGGGLFVFFHFGALDIDPTELRIGDKLEYEMGFGRDRRPRAVRVTWADD